MHNLYKCSEGGKGVCGETFDARTDKDVIHCHLTNAALLTIFGIDERTIFSIIIERF